MRFITLDIYIPDNILNKSKKRINTLFYFFSIIIICSNCNIYIYIIIIQVVVNIIYKKFLTHFIIYIKNNLTNIKI